MYSLLHLRRLLHSISKTCAIGVYMNGESHRVHRAQWSRHLCEARRPQGLIDSAYSYRQELHAVREIALLLESASERVGSSSDRLAVIAAHCATGRHSRQLPPLESRRLPTVSQFRVPSITCFDRGRSRTATQGKPNPKPVLPCGPLKSHGHEDPTDVLADASRRKANNSFIYVRAYKYPVVSR